MKVLITGANGMVARAVIKHCRSIGDQTIALMRRELDIADAKQVEEIFRRELPDAVINCAAYTDVDGAESNREASFQVNAVGVENLALASKKIDAAFVTISTDYVFDGLNAGFYTQKDTPNPISFYGESKLEGEIRARNVYARSIVVRSSWIYGEDGTNFLSVMHQLLAAGKTIKAISDAYGTPTNAGDLAVRLRELAELDLPAVYHVTNAGDGTSYEGFARKVAELKNFNPNLIQSVSGTDLQRPAPRPVSSKLACLISEKFGLASLPNWEESLAGFLK
ncbi:MAG: dTDP-4-dehydrorhamnose reductase [Pyrinomonadaceae bacterium]|nr:dTDP-4-dehydrorhamnose reductase [Pyrinomonadaceae bacterium]